MPEKSVLIVLRHGIFSSHHIFENLESRLTAIFPEADIDNSDYNWKSSIVQNGLELAKDILRKRYRSVAFVGHSMGGLVSRVANLAMTEPSFIDAVYRAAYSYGYGASEVWAASQAAAAKRESDEKHVSCIICLATPNSGAMSNAQLCLSANMVKAFVNAGVPGLQDLNGLRLFRLLQHFSTMAFCLTISGSYASRYGHGAMGPVAKVLKFALEVPHDGVVEDVSVDLGESTLPTEFKRDRHHHIRQYVDCHEVNHTNIHQTEEVLSLVIDYLGRHISAQYDLFA